MSREDETQDPRLFDRRTVERSIKKGIITRKDYERYLKSLEDAKAKIAARDTDSETPESS